MKKDNRWPKQAFGNIYELWGHFQLLMESLQVTGNVRENIKMTLWKFTFKIKSEFTQN